MRKAHVKTINEHLVGVLGFRRALTCESFMMLWAMFEAAEGREPRNVEELAEAMGRHPASVYRWLADFRQAFPEHSTPGELMGPLREALGEKMTVKRVGAIPAGQLGVT